MINWNKVVGWVEKVAFANNFHYSVFKFQLNSYISRLFSKNTLLK